jgi:branched-chain amino acid transport system permease protein
MDNLAAFLQFFVSGASLGGLYALMALGLALVYSILRLVNFAYGELVMIGGYTLLIVGLSPLPWLIAALTAVGMAILTSVLLERVAFRPVRHASAATMLITSFAVSALLQNAARLFITPRPQAVPIPSFLTGSFQVGGVFISQREMLSLAVSLIILVLLTVFLKRSTLGIALRASADDFVMARVLGVRANAVIATAFAISGALAGIVALFWMARVGTVTPEIGLTPVLIAFVAIVIGGMGSLTGAVIGGYLLGFLTVALQLLLPPSLRIFSHAFLFALVIAVLVFRPEGLIASRAAVERV